MSNLLESVDIRTQLAERSRLELLLFRVGATQRYGINVFKVREVLECPPLRWLPHAHPDVRGVAHVRGQTLPVIDLSRVLGGQLPAETRGQYVVITEFNRSMQGFLVSSVDAIINVRWDAILPPPAGAAVNYLTAITQLEQELIQIVDVEQVMAEIIGMHQHLSTEVVKNVDLSIARPPVLLVDDSSVARTMVQRTLEEVGVCCYAASNGREGLNMLKQWCAGKQPLTQVVSLVLSDIEMPEMDGYTLTSEIRKDPQLKDLYIILHSSLSGSFNDAMVKKVGADRFVAKFDPDELAQVIVSKIDNLYHPRGEGEFPLK